MSTISARGEPEGLAVAAALARPLAGDGHIDAVIAENAGQQIDVGKPRHVVQRQRLAGEKAGDHQRQRSVLGATDGYGAGQTLAADNADTVHDVITPSAPGVPCSRCVFALAHARLGGKVSKTVSARAAQKGSQSAGLRDDHI